MKKYINKKFNWINIFTNKLYAITNDEVIFGKNPNGDTSNERKYE